MTADNPLKRQMAMVATEKNATIAALTAELATERQAREADEIKIEAQADEIERLRAHPVTAEMLERVEHAFSHWKDGYSADSARSVTAEIRAAIAAMKEMK